MNTENKVKINELIDKASLVLIGLLLLFFPLVLTLQTTDVFILPKQAFLGAFSLAILLLFGLRSLLNNKVVVRRNPFDLPVFLFTLAVLLSSVFAVNKADSFIAFVPFLFIVFAYFVIVNTAKTKTGVLFLLSALILGGLITSVLSILSFFKIYALPFTATHVQTFTTLGSLIDQALYLAFILPLAAYLAYPLIAAYKAKRREGNELETASVTSNGASKSLAKLVGFGLSTIIILIGLLVTIYELVYLQKPLFLPLETGFQTAFAAISQDTGRVIQGFLFGSGYGNYGVVFSRFKQAAFNTDPNLWSFTFFRSSTYVLELLATTGVLGLLSFLLLIYKIVKERPVFVPLILIIAAAFILPFSFVTQALIFLLLALFVAVQGLEEQHQHRFFDVELQLVALKKGIISLLPTDEESKVKQDGLSRLLPGFIFVIVCAFVLGLGFLSTRYVLSNVKFQDSLIAASQNNGQLTYSRQQEAIQLFGFSEAYYRFFAQTNFSLANSLASSISTKTPPETTTTQTVYTLIQQSINAARQATAIAPQNAIGWQNLSGIYRGLIGFGQNADSFAILSAQQAVILDPNNPQEYINLGGIYFQLSQWDKAEQQFQQAVSLKPDFPNAYYNLGHALQEKGDLKGALAQYQIVKSLVANDTVNLDKINAEIQAIEARIGQAQSQTETQGQTTANPLTIPTPSTTLPKQDPPVKIPGPSVSPIPSSSPTPTASPTPAPTVTP